MKTKEDAILSQVLTTGGNGMVGSYVDFGIKLDRRALDVTDLNDALFVCRQHKPKVIIHLAAETDVGRCERDPQYAYLVNTIGSYNMALAAKEIGAKLIYVSTSAVFDGSKKDPYIETDECNPQSYYGRSKFLGEVAVKSVLNDYIIARVCWMFGGGQEKDKKFVAKIIEQTKGSEIKIISGKYGSPTYGKDLVGALKKLILQDATGIFHLSNKGSPSRFDVAKEIIKITGSKTNVTEVDPSFFSNIHSESMPNNNNESLSSKIDLIRGWQEAVREYILEEWPTYVKKY